MTNQQTKINQLAHHEVEWWKAHHRKQRDKLVDEMAKLYELQFGISYEQAREAVIHRVEAAKWHDRAEELEDSGKQSQADKYWERTEQSLRKHFEILESLTD